MTTAHSPSTPPRDPHADNSGAWPVIARIPDLSAEARPQRPPRPSAPARPTGRRFDAPQPRAAVATPAPTSTVESRSEIGKHTAHLPQPPAHHLHQRTARLTTIHDQAPSESPVLPDWNPFANPGKRLPDALAPILSFLVMVALFTAAGTSVLMLRSGPQPPATEQPPQTRIEQAAAAPTAVGPLGVSASRLVPTGSNEPTTAAIPTPSKPKLAPSADATGNDMTEIAPPPAAGVPTDDNAFPANVYPEPIFPPTIEVHLPQAATTDTPLPIARFSGRILEAPTRQAKHDDQSSIH